MSNLLAGKVAVVTGGYTGIGRIISDTLASNGVSLALTARTSSDLEQYATGLRRRGVDVRWFVADVSEPEGASGFIEYIACEFGRIDYLFNCAGVYKPSTPEDAPEVLGELMRANLQSKVLVCSRAFPVMKKSGGGHIINISSIAALKPELEGSLAYGTSMQAVNRYTEGLNIEGKRCGIKAHALALGTVDTPRTRRDFTQLARKKLAESGLTEESITEEDLDRFFRGIMVSPQDLSELVLDLIRNPDRYPVIHEHSKGTI